VHLVGFVIRAHCFT